PRILTPSTVALSNYTLTAGPLIITEDIFSQLLDDASKPILIAADRKGDNAARTQNDHYSRLYSTAPKITLKLRYTPYSFTNNWGQGVRSLSLRFSIRAKASGQTGTVLATSPLINTNNYTARSYQSYSANFSVLKSSSFQGLIALHLVRKTKMRPGYSSASSGYTDDFSLTLTAQPILNPSTALTNQPLYLELYIKPVLSKSFTRPFLQTLANSLTLEMTHLS
ncbi:MAG: hypothetical protein ACON4Q_02005, partial [Candidatus Puniceispirillaceae bacterium]